MVAGAGFVGLSGDTWMGINKETSYGTKVGPTSAENFLFLSENLHAEKPVIPVPNIAAAFSDLAQVFSGATVVSGDIEVAVPYEGLENLLLHCMGTSSAVSAGSGSFTNTMDLTSRGRFRSTTSPALTFHMSRGVVGSGATNPTVFSYEGCVIDSFTFSCGRDQPLKLKVTLFGQDETVAAYSGSTSFPTAPIANFTECQVTWGATAIPVTEFSVTCTRDIDKGRIFGGSTVTEEPPMAQYDVTGTMTTEWDNEKRVGTSTLRDDYQNKTPRTFVFKFFGPGISGTAKNYQFFIHLAQARISSFPVSVSGRGRVTVPVAFKGWDSDVTTAPHDLRLILQNARNFVDN